MDLTQITKILTEESGIPICPICCTPFKPYHSRQKTCGTEECKRLWHNQYVRERVEKKKAIDLEGYRKYRSDASRRHRNKKKKLKERDAELKRIQEQWQKQEEFDKRISEFGHEYGKRSADKVLATVPKIDVTLGGKIDGSQNNKSE